MPSQERDQLELILNETKLLDNKMKNYKTECINELNWHCFEQKRLIQLATELKIQNLEEKDNSQSKIDLINQSNEKLIEIIDKYEQTCLEDFKNRTDFVYLKFFFDSEIFPMKAKFNDLSDHVSCIQRVIDRYLKENQANNDSFLKIIKDYDDLKFEINKELKKLKNLIFNSNKIEFVENDETYLGYFEYDHPAQIHNFK